MLTPKRIIGFVLRLVVIYGLLVIPWPGIKGAYAALYSAGANFAYKSVLAGGLVRFHPVEPPGAKYDTHIHYSNLASGAKSTFKTSSRDPAYLQTAFLVSLVLATTLSWRRRILASLYGLMLLHIAIYGKVLITVLYGASRHKVAILDPSPTWERVLVIANRFASQDVVMLLIIPVLIWFLVTFRAWDWMRSESTQVRPMNPQDA